MSLITYANDMLNSSRSVSGMEENFIVLQNDYKQLGLEFNEEKLEILLFNWKSVPDAFTIALGNAKFKPVQFVTYLGLPIGSTLKTTCLLLITDVQNRIDFSYSKVVSNKLRLNRKV